MEDVEPGAQSNLVPLREIIQRFGTAAKVYDIPEQLLEGIADLPLDTPVPEVPAMAAEILVSRIIDVILLTTVNETNLRFRLAPLCNIRKAEERKKLIDSVQTAAQIFNRIEHIKYVLPVQPPKDQISPKLSNMCLARCFSFLQPLVQGRSLFKVLSRKAYMQAQDENFVKLFAFPPSVEFQAAWAAEMANSGAGRWVLCQEPGDPCFDIIIKNLDQMNELNPMKDDTLTIEADVVLKTKFPGSITQIMIHLWSESPSQKFVQQCILDECQSNVDLTFPCSFQINLSELSQEFRSTLKIQAFWDMNHNAEDAKAGSLAKVSQPADGKLHVENLSDSRQIAYWSVK